MNRKIKINPSNRDPEIIKKVTHTLNQLSKSKNNKKLANKFSNAFKESEININKNLKLDEIFDDKSFIDIKEQNANFLASYNKNVIKKIKEKDQEHKFKEMINTYVDKGYKIPNLSLTHNLFKPSGLIIENENILRSVKNECVDKSILVKDGIFLNNFTKKVEGRLNNDIPEKMKTTTNFFAKLRTIDPLSKYSIDQIKVMNSNLTKEISSLQKYYSSFTEENKKSINYNYGYIKAQSKHAFKSQGEEPIMNSKFSIINKSADKQMFNFNKNSSISGTTLTKTIGSHNFYKPSSTSIVINDYNKKSSNQIHDEESEKESNSYNNVNSIFSLVKKPIALIMNENDNDKPISHQVQASVLNHDFIETEQSNNIPTALNTEYNETNYTTLAKKHGSMLNISKIVKKTKTASFYINNEGVKPRSNTQNKNGKFSNVLELIQIPNRINLQQPLTLIPSKDYPYTNKKIDNKEPKQTKEAFTFFNNHRKNSFISNNSNNNVSKLENALKKSLLNSPNKSKNGSPLKSYINKAKKVTKMKKSFNAVNQTQDEILERIYEDIKKTKGDISENSKRDIVEYFNSKYNRDKYNLTNRGKIDTFELLTFIKETQNVLNKFNMDETYKRFVEKTGFIDLNLNEIKRIK